MSSLLTEKKVLNREWNFRERLPSRVNLLERLVVVLVRPEGPLNVGSVARLCGNFGCSLRLVSPIADRTGLEAIMMSHPSELLLDRAPIFGSLAEALRDVSLAVGTSARIADAASAPWLSVPRARLMIPDAGETLALVFGNERTGLAIDEAQLCPRLIRLPTPGPTESLNLSHAVAVTLALFNAATERDDATFRAPAAARQALINTLDQQLEARQFFRGDTRRRDAFAPRLKELTDKMDLSERDFSLLQDLLRVLCEDPKRP